VGDRSIGKGRRILIEACGGLDLDCSDHAGFSNLGLFGPCQRLAGDSADRVPAHDHGRLKSWPANSPFVGYEMIVRQIEEIIGKSPVTFFNLFSETPAER
jgi:hypothetical protein